MEERLSQIKRKHARLRRITQLDKWLEVDDNLSNWTGEGTIGLIKMREKRELLTKIAAKAWGSRMRMLLTLNEYMYVFSRMDCVSAVVWHTDDVVVVLNRCQTAVSSLSTF